jgi:F0F1-type ATP synthase assembly protein I
MSIAPKKASLDKSSQISYYLSGIMDQQDQNPLQKNTPAQKDQSKVIGVLMAEAGIEFAFLIGGPLILGILAGPWLDNRYHHNFFVIIGILLGLTISCFAIYVRIKHYKKILDNKDKK